MTLEKDLQQLQSLGVGSVERVIGEIEGKRVEIDNLTQGKETSVEQYRRIVEEKLPKVIDNIVYLGKYIVELGNKFGHYPLESSFDIENIKKERVVRFSKGSSWYKQFTIDFDSTASVLSLRYGGSWIFSKILGIIPTRKEKPIWEIVAKDSTDFTRRFTEMHLSDEGIRKASEFISQLNEVPQRIVAAYERQILKGRHEIKEIDTKNQKLSSLDVSDFS